LDFEATNVGRPKQACSAQIGGFNPIGIAQNQPANARQSEQSRNLIAKGAHADNDGRCLGQLVLLPTRNATVAFIPVVHATPCR
jgi:hypothetical protein